MKKRTYKLIETISKSIIEVFPYLTAKEHSEVMENFIYNSIKHNLSEALSDKQIKADIERAQNYAYWMDRYKTEKDPKEKEKFKTYTIVGDKDKSKRDPLLWPLVLNPPKRHDKTDYDKEWRRENRAEFSQIGREIDGEDTDPYRTWDPDDKIRPSAFDSPISYIYPKNQKGRHIDGEDTDQYRNVDPKDLIPSNKGQIALIAALTGGTLASAAVLYNKYGPGLISKLKAKVKPSKLSQVKNTFKKLMKKIKLAEAKNMM